MDMNRCPQTEAEFTEYFYALIGRFLETDANDWYSVMLKRYDWKGQLISIPRGVGPGIKQAPDAPFFGLTQQMGSAGNPQARIFLPTSQPDSLGYYTRNIQYIKDKPGGVHGTDFLWTWWYQDGQAYTPVTGAEPTPPQPPVENLEMRVAALEREVTILKAANHEQKERLDDLEGRILKLEEAPTNGVSLAEVVALLRRTYAEGRTQTSAYHSHQSRLPLVVPE